MNAVRVWLNGGPARMALREQVELASRSIKERASQERTACEELRRLGDAVRVAVRRNVL